jgi:hypothetical protein
MFLALALMTSVVTLPIFETGCHTQLSGTGVYGTDTAAYDMDLAISTSKNVIESFLTWEKANRPLLSTKYPDIRVYADKLRAEAPGWLKSAVAVRDSYATTHSQTDKTAFDAAMSVLDQAVTQAQTYLAKAATPKKA